MNTLTLLGTGTCQIEYQRRASSVLLNLDGTPILFDCGHGIVQRLLEVGVNPNKLQHIILSHFHPDHVSDLIPLLHAGAWSQKDPRRVDLHIYGPPGTQQFLDALFDLFGRSAFQQPDRYTISIHERGAGQHEVAGHLFEAVSLPPAGNHGVRFVWNGKTYALTGDSNFHDEEIAFLRDVDLAIIDSGHITDEQIVQLAVESKAHVIVCSHQYRELDEVRLQQSARRQGYTGTILVGYDFMSFSL